jgi:hypothetical protein
VSCPRAESIVGQGDPDLPFVGTCTIPTDLRGGAQAKNQVISRKGELFIKQADLELYKATGKVKWKLVPFKSADFYADPLEVPELTNQLLLYGLNDCGFHVPSRMAWSGQFV